MTSDKRKKSNFRKYLGYAVPFLLTAIFLHFAFRNVDIGQAIGLISHISIPWLILFLFTFIFSHAIRAVRWKVMIDSVKPGASIFNLFSSTMIGYGVNSVVPRLGEVYRGVFLGKLEGISRSSMLGTIIVERVIDILSLGFSVLISVIIYPGDLFDEFIWLESALVVGFSAMAGLILLLYFTVKFKGKFYDVIVTFAGKFSSKLAEKLAYIFNMLTEGFASIKGKKNYFFTILLSVIIMLIYGLTSYLGFLVLRMNEIQPVTYGMAWVLMTISAFGIVIPTPGGTGSYHLLNMTVLINLFHFSKEISSAYAILTHFISYVIFILLPITLFFVLNKRRTRNGEERLNFFNVFKNKPEAQ